MLRKLHRSFFISIIAVLLLMLSGASVEAQNYCTGISWEVELSSGDEIED
jgi:hypothetical protein